jgi:tRNA A37 threonylcarbamoyltransferase TsaD
VSSTSDKPSQGSGPPRPAVFPDSMVHRVYGKTRDEAVGELLTRQARRVRVVYVSEANSNRTQPKRNERKVAKTA